MDLRGVIAGYLGLAGVVGMLLREGFPDEQDADVMTCPHCGWLGLIVRKHWFYRSARCRLIFEPHPDLRERTTTCLMRGSVDATKSTFSGHGVVDSDPETLLAEGTGLWWGTAFRLVEQNAAQAERDLAAVKAQIAVQESTAQ